MFAKTNNESKTTKHQQNHRLKINSSQCNWRWGCVFNIFTGQTLALKSTVVSKLFGSQEVFQTSVMYHHRETISRLTGKLPMYLISNIFIYCPQNVGDIGAQKSRN